MLSIAVISSQEKKWREKKRREKTCQRAEKLDIRPTGDSQVT